MINSSAEENKKNFQHFEIIIEKKRTDERLKEIYQIKNNPNRINSKSKKTTTSSSLAAILTKSYQQKLLSN